MKRSKKTLILTCAWLASIGLALGTTHIIPKPQSIIRDKGALLMRDNQKATFKCEAKKLTSEAQKLRITLKNDLKINTKTTGLKHETPLILIQQNNTLPHEAYILSIQPNQIHIQANSFAGVAYATNSLLQLFLQNKTEHGYNIPCLTINDAPRFAYRGVHIDVARHFFPFDSLMRLVDIAALHKLNRIHLHLTDNQGWRIEIKRYPKLTEIGAWRDSTIIGRNGPEYKHERHGGFYTQKQLKQFVAYALQKQIEVLPEIDLPGHTLAALAAYPEYGCKGANYTVSSKWGISDEALCPGNENTYTFVQNILDEVIKIFPYNYIHIGGDECLKGDWEKCPKCQSKIKSLKRYANSTDTAEEQLQSYFTQRIENYLDTKNKKLIGWDEILEGGLSPKATVMAWRNTQYGYKAARMGNNAILTPSEYCYFNFYQTPYINGEPEALDGCVNLEKVYSFEPTPKTHADIKNNILGIQACLWSEHVTTFKTAEYMLLPRLAALAEVAWSDSTKDYHDFTQRLIPLLDIYQQKGFAYSKELFVVKPQIIRNYQNKQQTIAFTATNSADIRYTTNGNTPTLQSPRFESPIPITKNTTVKAVAFFNNEPSKTRIQEFIFSKSTLCPTTLQVNPSPTYTFDGAEVLSDGLTGDMNYKSGRWLGFVDTPLIATIDLQKNTSFSEISFNTLVSVWDWIFRPEYCLVETSNDNINFAPKGKLLIDPTPKESYLIEKYTIRIPQTEARFIRVTLNPIIQMPSWHPGKGKPAFIFIDEISII